MNVEVAPWAIKRSFCVLFDRWVLQKGWSEKFFVGFLSIYIIFVGFLSL